jgi:hypothetical protein
MGYQLIETYEVGSGGVSSIEFTGIPQDGVDLVVKLSARSDRTSTVDQVELSLNSSTSNFSYINLRGSGTTVFSSSSTDSLQQTMVTGGDATSDTFGNAEFYFFNYTSSSAKSFSGNGVSENNATQAWASMQANLWNNTAAIASVSLSPAYGTNFLQHSTASLYKITAD